MRFLTVISIFLFFFLGPKYFVLGANYFEVPLDSGFVVSLDRLNSTRQKQTCGKSTESICPNMIQELIQDDDATRSLIFRPYAKVCDAPLAIQSKIMNSSMQKNPLLTYKIFSEKVFSNLGPYSLSTAKACLNLTPEKSVQALSKFFHYSSRLNEGAKKISQEQSLVAKLLNQPQPECPNADFLAQANQVCKVAQKCPSDLNLQDLAAKALKDEALYDQIFQQIEALPKDCKSQPDCKAIHTSLQVVAAGLLQLNPWLLSAEYQRTKQTHSVTQRLTAYLKSLEKNLKNHEKNISQAAACLHGSQSLACDVDQFRAVIATTPRMSESFKSDPDINFASRMMEVQSCREEAIQDRNLSSGAFNEAFKNAGIGLLTLGVGGLVRQGFMATAQVLKAAGSAAVIGLDVYVLTGDGYQAYQSCFADEKVSQFRKLEDKEICSATSSALSPQVQAEGSCLVDAGLTSFAGLVTATSAIKPLKGFTPYLQSLQKSKLEKRRAADLAASSNLERRIVKTSASSANTGKEVVTEIKSIPSITNFPDNMIVEKTLRLDGTEVLEYVYVEKLPNGSFRSVRKTLPLDPLSGGIDANYDTGREFLEKLVASKAGKAHLVFIDVGILGKVNREFAGKNISGDRYLKSVSDAIKKYSDGKITLARTGGDEFGLIIDEADPKKVQEILTKIQNELRHNLDGDAHAVFREEKIIRTENFKAYEKENLAERAKKGPLTQQDYDEVRALARKQIDDLARYQQPDISVGSIKIGQGDDLGELLSLAESQAAKEMKIPTALRFGRDVTKYQSKEIPDLRPSPMFKAAIPEPLGSVNPGTLSASHDLGIVPNVKTVPSMSYEHVADIKRVSSLNFAKFKDELGNVSYKLEDFVIDPVTQKKIQIVTDVPIRGATGLWDGFSDPGQKLILENFKSNENMLLLFGKVKSLRTLNYFEEGSAAGNAVLKATAEEMTKNMRSTDLVSKLSGSDFLWSADHIKVSQLKSIEKKINEQVIKNPLVQAVLNKERLSILREMSKEQLKALPDPQVLSDLMQRQKDLQNFKVDFQFESVTQAEAKSRSQGGLKSIHKFAEDKFDLRSNP